MGATDAYDEEQSLVAVTVNTKEFGMGPSSASHEVVSYTWLTKAGGGCGKVDTIPSPKLTSYNVEESFDSNDEMGNTKESGAHRPSVFPGFAEPISGLLPTNNTSSTTLVQPLLPTPVNVRV